MRRAARTGHRGSRIQASSHEHLTVADSQAERDSVRREDSERRAGQARVEATEARRAMEEARAERLALQRAKVGFHPSRVKGERITLRSTDYDGIT